MRIPGFIAPFIVLISTIRDVFDKDGDGGGRVTRAELRQVADRLEEIVDRSTQTPSAIGDDIMVCIGIDGPDEAPTPVLRPGKIVRVWGGTTVNAQVFLDGTNDTRHLEKLGIEKPPVCIWWATSISAGDGVGYWRRA